MLRVNSHSARLEENLPGLTVVDVLLALPLFHLPCHFSTCLACPQHNKLLSLATLFPLFVRVCLFGSCATQYFCFSGTCSVRL